jgi:hypothetical protein
MLQKFCREIRISPFLSLAHLSFLFLVWKCNTPRGKLKIKEDTIVHNSESTRIEDYYWGEGEIDKKTTIGLLTKGQEVTFIAGYETKSQWTRRITYKYASAYIASVDWDKFDEIHYWHSYGTSHFCAWIVNLFEGCENY